MIGIFLTGAFIISGLLIFNRNIFVNYALLVIFIAFFSVFGFFEFHHINVTELEFFKPDALGILLLTVLCVISIPVIFHGYRYI